MGTDAPVVDAPRGSVDAVPAAETYRVPDSATSGAAATPDSATLVAGIDATAGEPTEVRLGALADAGGALSEAPVRDADVPTREIHDGGVVEDAGYAVGDGEAQATVAQAGRPEAAPTVSPTAAESLAAARDLEGTGFTIGRGEFRARAKLTGDPATDAAVVREAYVTGIRGMLPTDREPTSMELHHMHYAVLRAQMAGVSREELRVGLGASLDAIQGGGGERVRGAINAGDIGLPDTVADPAHPQAITETERAEAANARREVVMEMGRIRADARMHDPQSLQSLNINIPRSDVVEMAASLVEEASSTLKNHKKGERLQRRILTYMSSDDLAEVMYQGGFSIDKKKGRVLELIERSARYNGEARKRQQMGGRPWRSLNPQEREAVIGREQIRALMARDAELKAIEAEYKKALPLYLQILLFTSGQIFAAGWETTTGEIGRVVNEGQAPGGQ